MELNVGKVRIKVITSYKIAIRICELKNIFKIFGETGNFGENYKEYRNLMNYLTDNEYTIKHILCFEDSDFILAIDYIKNGAENHYISLMLIKIREIIINNRSGCNILRYLTSKMVNTIIRDQIGVEPNRYLSNLYIHKKSGMFDAMPFAMSLHNHNPQFYDLIMAIDVENKDDELLYSYIRNNTESNDELYTPIDEIGYFNNIPNLIEKYNSKLKSRLPRSDGILVLDNNFIYIKEYEKNSIEIIKKLEEYSNKLDDSLNDKVGFYMDLLFDDEISDDKEKILKDIFKNSSIAFIYGPAGTGKTKMIEILSEVFGNYKKCVIANTNTAVSNLNVRLREDDNLDIMTINNF